MKAAISWLFQRNIVDEGGGGSEWVERGTWVLHLYVNYKQSCIECRMQFRHLFRIIAVLLEYFYMVGIDYVTVFITSRLIVVFSQLPPFVVNQLTDVDVTYIG